MSSFLDRTRRAWQVNDSLLCVGLDPVVERIPKCVADHERPYFEFCSQIVDATAPYCAAYKPQAAHFGAAGREDELAELCGYIKAKYPEHLLILDAKRGDIGSTAELYAKEAYQRYGADTVTVNPYLGAEACTPYLSYKDKGIVVLCRTSNAGSDWMQKVGEPPMYLRVAQTVAEWNDTGQCMLVAGATYAEELGAIRDLVPEIPLLVPGIGAQGGDLLAVLKNGLDSDGHGLFISSSRGIIYASDQEDFAEAAGSEAALLDSQIRDIRSEIFHNSLNNK